MKKLLVAVMLIGALAIPAMASVDLHVKWFSQGMDTVIGPGLGWYSVQTGGGFGFDVEYTIGGLTYSTTPANPCEEIPRSWELVSCGFLEALLFYDIPIGGCSPGPCDVDMIRIGAGIGLPLAFQYQSNAGLGIGSAGIGGIISASYVWPSWSVKWEAFYNGEMTYMLSAHFWIPVIAQKP